MKEELPDGITAEVKPHELPNGFVVRGPRGVPVLVDFDDNGEPTAKGTEITIDGWLQKLGRQIPDDVLILVHSVKVDDAMLHKSLEVNHILRDGKKTTVIDVVKHNALFGVAKALRKKYVEKVRREKCGSIQEGMDGCGSVPTPPETEA